MLSDMETLLALATRCEQATGPDRELDARIYCAVHGNTFSRPYGNDFAMHVRGVPHEVKIIDRYLARYTASLDAALTLVPVGHALSLHVDADGTVHAGVMPDDGDGCDAARRCGATPALSLTVAALRARAAECSP